MDNEMESSLQQYQSCVYPDKPDFSYSVRNDNQFQFSPEQLREKLRKQLEYYFSKENIINDIYLQSQMDSDNYVPISIIANFKLIKRLTHDLQLIIDVLKESSLVEVDHEEKKVRSSNNKIYLPTRKRCIIILRNIPLDATENEILGLFINEYCSISVIECERVLESNHSDCWYVTFNNENDAQNAFLYLTRENISIRGQKVLARMKARLWQKPLIPSNDNITQNSNSIQEQYTPVYIQSIPTNPANQSSFFGNTSQQQSIINYRPTQILQQYYQPTFLNFHQQNQYINRYNPVFPTNFWYIPSTTDSYSSMTYNGTNKSKTRLTTPKLWNSTKPINSHEGFSNLQNSYQNNTLYSSSILRNETILNHSNDPKI